MLLSVMFGEENWALSQLSEAETLENLLTELLVLSAQVPLDVALLLDQLTNGISNMLECDRVQRSVDYANYRMSQYGEEDS
jgi:hypothetical protein